MKKRSGEYCYHNEVLKVSIISTFFIGMIAHGYAFLNFFHRMITCMKLQ